MNLPIFGNDPIDALSTPLNVKKTKLAQIFTMKVRENPEKPGRILSVVWDSRSPLIDGFINNHSYIVAFKEKGIVAGNHYHKVKEEIFYPITGEFTAVLEDINSRDREEIKLQTNDHLALYVPVNIAHAFRADSDIATFLVIATSPGVESDELPYKLL